MTEINGKPLPEVVELIRAALNDWAEGDMSYDTTLFVITQLVHERPQPNPADMEWARQVPEEMGEL